MNKKQILFSALFLTFVCASAGAVPPEPSALSAFCPPSEGKAFHSEWISLGLKAADLKEKQASAGHITDVGEAVSYTHLNTFIFLTRKKLEVKNIRRSSFGYKKGTTRVV